MASLRHSARFLWMHRLVTSRPETITRATHHLMFTFLSWRSSTEVDGLVGECPFHRGKLGVNELFYSQQIDRPNDEKIKGKKFWLSASRATHVHIDGLNNSLNWIDEEALRFDLRACWRELWSHVKECNLRLNLSRARHVNTCETKLCSTWKELTDTSTYICIVFLCDRASGGSSACLGPCLTIGDSNLRGCREKEWVPKI